jgi:hypothetical protein
MIPAALCLVALLLFLCLRPGSRVGWSPGEMQRLRDFSDREHRDGFFPFD